MSTKKKSDYLFLTPAAFIYLSVIVVPAFYSFYLSMFRWNGIAKVKKFVGIGNYIFLFTKDKTFIQSISNNVIWVLLTMTITVAVALSFALLLNQKFKGRTFFRGLFYFPYVLSGVIVAIIWTWVYHPQLGLIINFLNAVGLERFSKPFLADPKTAFFAVYVGALWQAFGAPMILFLAGLQTIPKDLYEAARIDGANAVQSFINVTIPMLRETFVIVFATQIITALKVYDVIWAMTNGGPAQKTQTMATWMVQQSFTFSNVGRGAAIACIMLIVMMVIVIPFVLYMAKDE